MSFQNGEVGEVTRNLHESHNEILYMFFRPFPLIPTDAAGRKQCWYHKIQFSDECMRVYVPKQE